MRWLFLTIATGLALLAGCTSDAGNSSGTAGETETRPRGFPQEFVPVGDLPQYGIELPYPTELPGGFEMNSTATGVFRDDAHRDVAAVAIQYQRQASEGEIWGVEVVYQLDHSLTFDRLPNAKEYEVHGKPITLATNSHPEIRAAQALWTEGEALIEVVTFAEGRPSDEELITDTLEIVEALLQEQ